jgi:hypothetical protein
VQLGLKVMQTRLGLFEGFGDSVSLSANARDLLALVSIAVTALLGFVFPLIATGCDFGELTHGVCAHHPPWPVGMAVG